MRPRGRVGARAPHHAVTTLPREMVIFSSRLHADVHDTRGERETGTSTQRGYTVDHTRIIHESGYIRSYTADSRCTVDTRWIQVGNTVGTRWILVHRTADTRWIHGGYEVDTRSIHGRYMVDLPFCPGVWRPGKTVNAPCIDYASRSINSILLVGRASTAPEFRRRRSRQPRCRRL